MRRLVNFSLILFNLLTYNDVSAEITYDDANNPNGLNRLERIKESEKQIQGLDSKLDSLKSSLSSQNDRLLKLEELRAKIEVMNKEMATLKESLNSLKTPAKIEENTTVQAVSSASSSPKNENLNEIILLKNEDTRINEELRVLRKENSSLRESLKSLEQMVYDLNSKAQFKKPNAGR
ncbi:MAG: hypothetical protein L6Q33_08190 [Bacteriovoracaceae bacterium]|nr:hypothetical protein [Bacteriovoracaceae bacterium]